MDSKADQFHFYVLTWLKLRDDCMKIHADLTNVCGAKCASYRTICRWIERFRAGKVSFEDCHHPGHPVSVKNEQTVLFFLKKLVKEDPHTTIRENVKHVTFKLAQLEDLCAMI